jgi:hypothetical protein
VKNVNPGTSVGKLLLLFGLVATAAGLLLLFFPKSLTWFGKLPGDIRIVRENVRIYVPITSMLLASLLLSVLFRILIRFK